MGWIAILKDRTETREIADEMEKDLERLEIITDRFSKIGSKPNLKEENVVEVVNAMIDYLKNRAPSKIRFSVQSESNAIMAELNTPLFGWVIENLCKNAMDAIEGPGEIRVDISTEQNKVIIDLSDTGKGIPTSKKKQVFEPGYTSKKRGWGLGLSLSKRIIENYHHGKIFVKWSEPGKGTTFRIVL
jgi:signal transduction histidine kinase